MKKYDDEFKLEGCVQLNLSRSGFIDENGGADGTRTRDLQRDRAVIDLLKEG